MSLAGPAGVDQDDVVILVKASPQGILYEFCVGLARTTGKIEDGRVLRVRTARWNQNDPERQLASALGLAILEDPMNPAAQILLDVGDAARLQHELRPR
jgi:hypothetical protein